MKKNYSLIIIISLSLCLTNFINANDKKAIMMEKFEDPLAGMIVVMGEKHVAKIRKQMGEKGAIKEYKHCIQNVNTEGFVEIYKMQKQEASEESEFNNIRKIDLIEKCPLPANAGCDHGTRIEYFYTSSNTFLEEQKEGCDFFKMKWITF